MMKLKSTQPFNAMGVIAPEAGMIIETDNQFLAYQLKLMGYVESAEPAKESTKQKRAEIKKQQKQ